MVHTVGRSFGPEKVQYRRVCTCINKHENVEVRENYVVGYFCSRSLAHWGAEGGLVYVPSCLGPKIEETKRKKD